MMRIDFSPFLRAPNPCRRIASSALRSSSSFGTDAAGSAGTKAAIDLLHFLGDRFRFRHARPGRIDAVEQAARDRRALQHLEIFLARAALGRTADALALVHAHAGSGDLGKRFAEERTETAGFHRGETSWIERNVAVREKERRRVPNQPRRFPDFDESQLFRKALRIAGRLKGFAREDRRSGVMAVRLVVVRTETRHDHIRSKSPDDPDDVRENLVAIPNAQRLFRVFRETEIDRAGEELPAVIEPARGEKLLRANDAELFAAVPVRSNSGRRRRA